MTTNVTQQIDSNLIIKNKQKFDVDKNLFPFKNNYVHLSNDMNIHYIDEGKGPTIILLHGNPSWSFLYRKMISELKDSFRVIAPDYPGFGLSPTPPKYDFLPSTQSKVMEEFISHLNLKDFIIVMQDWGGPIGLNIAINQPERIKGLVLGNTWAWPLKRPGQKLFSLLMGGVIGRNMAKSFNGVWHAFMKLGFINKPTKAELDMYEAPFKNGTNYKQTSIFPKELRNSKVFLSNIESKLHKLEKKPVLFTWGSHDFAFQKPELNKFQSIFKNHQTKMLEASHFWQDEQGVLASKYIIDWAMNNQWIPSK